ncbi:PA2778 family cysteine peptidase [Marinobacter sp. TBZ242]|uniref:PA2778 family cysteine peptidase n=1 Tax=Marinobacter azerbaijanicus TaxID=3050455 RepID=A0ABT7I9N3_9GAMM|nr:PA2778 family cysteine peptidase [Marinobacter sp. TBZ242]MDL0430410.1 PA2778 family cysteine peptidase [Marinobacter sp. TBZ242]
MTISTDPRLLRIVASALLATILVGCASRPQWPEPDTLDMPPDAEKRVVLDNVPFFAQERYQCGPASLAMMLNSQGLNTNPEVLKELVYLPQRQGSLKVELVAAARAHGLLVYPLDGSLESLLQEVAAGNPVLVMQNLRFGWWPQWHFAVVMGFDAEKRNIILHTDTRDYHEETVEVFTATWQRAENWAAVMLPPDQLPATAEPLPYLMSANDLETTGRTRAATAAYRTAEQAWPDQPAAIMGQGNIAWEQGDLELATRHYQRLTRKFPGVAAGWNNLAHSLAALGCVNAAETAASCAAEINPERFGGSIPEVLNRDSTGTCPVLECPASD